MTAAHLNQSQLEAARLEAQKQWNANPCGALPADAFDKAYFDRVEDDRYRQQYWQREWFDYASYGGKKVLEIGTDLRQFAKAGTVCYGVDITDKHIELTRQNFAANGYAVDVRKADATQLPFSDATFNCVHSFGVLHHIPDVDKVLLEIHRVLKPGGVLQTAVHHTWSLHNLAFFVRGAAAAYVLAASVHIQSNGLPLRLNPEARAYLDNESFPLPSECFYRGATDIAEGKVCTIGAKAAAPTFVIWGDSHANRIANTLEIWGAKSGISGWQATKGSCPPLPGTKWAGDLLGCSAYNAAVQERISGDSSKVVVLGAIWANYAEGNLVSNPHSANRLDDEQSPGRWQRLWMSREEMLEAARKAFQRSIHRTVANLRQAGKLVLIVGPVPELEWSAPPRLAAAAQYGASAPTGPTLESFRARQRTVLDVLKEVGQRDGVAVVYPHEILCGEKVCDIVRNGKRLYFDDNHIDMEANRLLEPMIAAGFARLGVRPSHSAAEGQAAPR